jgi:hypothetical protein
MYAINVSQGKLGGVLCSDQEVTTANAIHSSVFQGKFGGVLCSDQKVTTTNAILNSVSHGKLGGVLCSDQKVTTANAIHILGVFQRKFGAQSTPPSFPWDTLMCIALEVVTS